MDRSVQEEAMSSSTVPTDSVELSGDAARVQARLREYALGPMRFMNLLSCFELGIVDLLVEDQGSGLTANQIADAIGGSKAHAVEQLLWLLVKEDFVSYDEGSGRYALRGLRHLVGLDRDRVLAWMTMIKVICLRQLYYLSESVKTGKVVGLQKLYGFEGTLYEATADNEDLRLAWGGMMDSVTSFIDEWFFENVAVPPGARVLDLAGNTGLGAILTHRYKPVDGLQVACFDFPEKEAEALRNFQANGVADRCSFIGGDVFEGVPKGFDIVMIKHFLDMFDKENVLRILRAVHEGLGVGGQVYVLVPIYSEDLKSSVAVDFFPAYFLGCTMAEGGPQKLSTYRRLMEQSGFDVTKAISQDAQTLPPDMVPVHGILCGTKAR